MKRKRKKDHWGYFILDGLIELILLPFRIIGYLFKGIGKMFDDIDF